MTDRLRYVALFGFALTAGLAVAFFEAWRQGWVLTEASFLLSTPPWSAYRLPGADQVNPLLSDVPTMMYPFLVHAADAFRAGVFPLWNAATFAGQPFFASAQSAVLSPFHVIGYLGPLPEATVGIAAAKILVGGAGMLAFLRRIGVSWPAAVVGGVAYAFNPFSAVWLEHHNSGVASWLGWLLWATEGAVAGDRRRDVAALAVGLAATGLSGHPGTALKVALLAAAFGVFRAVAMGRGRRGALGRLSAAWVGGILLTGIQVAPFVEYLRESRAYETRSTTALNVSIVPWRTAVTAFVPDFFGHPTGRTLLVTSRFGNPTNYNEQQVYPGMATWLLAGAGLLASRRRALAAFAAAAAAISAAFMYGAPGFVRFASVVPGLDVSVLSRFGLLVIASVMVLAALGVERLTTGLDEEGGTRSTRRARGGLRSLVRPDVMGVALAAGVAAGVIAWRLLDERQALSTAGLLWPTVGHAATAGLLALATLAGVALRVMRLVPTGAFATGLVALVLVDLVPLVRASHPLTPPAAVYPVVPEIAVVQADPGVFRIAGWGDAMLPNVNLVYGLAQFRGYDAMSLRRYGALLDAGIGDETRLHEPRPFVDSPLFDLLNVKYVFTRPDQRPPAGHYLALGGHGQLHQNARVFPRGFLVDHVLVVDPGEAIDVVAEGIVDLRRSVVLEEALPSEEQPDTVRLVADRAEIVAYADHEVVFRTRADGRRMLVLSDTHYPGWKAWVDDREAPIHRANAAFRAVSVPPGEHVVRFVYRPASFMLGLALSGAGIVWLAGWWVGARWTAGTSAAPERP